MLFRSNVGRTSGVSLCELGWLAGAKEGESSAEPCFREHLKLAIPSYIPTVGKERRRTYEAIFVLPNIAPRNADLIGGEASDAVAAEALNRGDSGPHKVQENPRKSVWL